MSEGSSNDSLTDFAGDKEGGRLLRASLTALLDRGLEVGLRGRIEAVLRGELSMRELSDDPGLRAIAEEGIDRLRTDLDDLSPAGRADLAAQAREMAARSEP